MPPNRLFGFPPISRSRLVFLLPGAKRAAESNINSGIAKQSQLGTSVPAGFARRRRLLNRAPRFGGGTAFVGYELSPAAFGSGVKVTERDGAGRHRALLLLPDGSHPRVQILICRLPGQLPRPSRLWALNNRAAAPGPSLLETHRRAAPWVFRSGVGRGGGITLRLSDILAEN